MSVQRARESASGAIRTARIALAAAAAAVTALLAVGCPHRSPVWSPDGRHVLLLGGAAGEELDRPATRLWVVPIEAGGDPAAASVKRLAVPAEARGVRFLAVAWLDAGSFAAFTVRWEDDEAVEGSEAVWKVELAGPRWSRIKGPPPSAERTTLHNPVVTRSADGAPRALVYPTGDEMVAAVDLASGKVGLEIATAQVVGPGPRGGFLVYRPDADTGGLILEAYGAGLERLWTRPFAAIRTDIAKVTSTAPARVVFNDASSSSVSAGGATVGVNLVFTDVSWNDGIRGYHAVLRSSDGVALAARGETCFSGVPVPTKPDAAGASWVWAVAPTTRRNVKTGSIRAFPLGKSAKPAPPSTDVVLEGVRKSAIHGYRLSPDGRRFAVSVNGRATRLLLYPVRGGAITGAARRVELE